MEGDESKKTEEAKNGFGVFEDKIKESEKKYEKSVKTSMSGGSEDKGALNGLRGLAAVHVMFYHSFHYSNFKLDIHADVSFQPQNQINFQKNILIHRPKCPCSSFYPDFA